MSAPGWRSKIALALGSSVIALALAAALGETLVRYRERHRTTPPGTMPTLFYRHSRLRHALVRNFDYFGWIHVDAEGFRGRGVAVDKPAGTLRIMADGGSTTFDSFVSGDERAWPARLDYWIRRIAPGRPVEVINSGVPGYRVVDNLIRLETELYRYHPDVVILYQGHNDLYTALSGLEESPVRASDTPDDVRVVTPWGHWLGSHSLLYGKLLGRWQAVEFHNTRRRSEAGRWAEAMDRGAADFERDLTSFIVVAQSLGIQVVLPEVVHVSGVGALHEANPRVAETWRLSVRAPMDVVLQAYVRYNGVLKAVAQRYRVPFIATGGFGLAGMGWYAEQDPIHFNDRGADRMAHQLAETLLSAGVLASQPEAGRAR